MHNHNFHYFEEGTVMRFDRLDLNLLVAFGALMEERSAITTSRDFDPLTAKREFSVIASDYVYDVILSDVLNSIAREAPDLTCHLFNPSAQTVSAFERDEIDLFIRLEEFLSQDHPARPLLQDSLRVVCWAENSLLGNLKRCTMLKSLLVRKET
ncbi:LysR substrate-binding domain-containing protein [Rhizobium sp.]|jgi:DNA-binding transcriptional LysR family regulator|uniref:LysR substrate-binding domain-containing protein n=1 Tax=Rhizobium sp. TaxID=391 RepID=UPI002AA726D8